MLFEPDGKHSSALPRTRTIPDCEGAGRLGMRQAGAELRLVERRNRLAEWIPAADA
jgi:hypothetical protein